MRRISRIIRIAIALLEGHRPAAQNGGGSYLDIGHDYVDATEWVLWMWDGALHVRHVPAGADRSMHSEQWPESAPYYRGRYDPQQHLVSLVVPDTRAARFRPVPPRLLEELEGAFPDATAIRTFDEGELF